MPDSAFTLDTEGIVRVSPILGAAFEAAIDERIATALAIFKQTGEIPQTCSSECKKGA